MDATVTLWRYEWLQRGRSERTFRLMARELERYRAWLPESLSVEDAGKRECLAYLAHRSEGSPQNGLYAWRTLRSFYGFLEGLDGTASPMAAVKTPKVPEPATKGISEAEYAKLLAVSDVRDKALFSLMRCTGLRRSEVVNLTLDDVDVDQRHVLVRITKTGKPRVVPMSQEATVAVLKYLRIRAKSPHAGSPRLWLGKKGPLSSDGLRLMIERRATEAGVKASAHMFRRAFAVDWLTNGGSQVSLMSLAGWSSPAMAARYTRHAAERVAEAEYRKLYA